MGIDFLKLRLSVEMRRSVEAFEIHYSSIDDKYAENNHGMNSQQHTNWFNEVQIAEFNTNLNK